MASLWTSLKRILQGAPATTQAVIVLDPEAEIEDALGQLQRLSPRLGFDRVERRTATVRLHRGEERFMVELDDAARLGENLPSLVSALDAALGSRDETICVSDDDHGLVAQLLPTSEIIARYTRRERIVAAIGADPSGRGLAIEGGRAQIDGRRVQLRLGRNAPIHGVPCRGGATLVFDDDAVIEGTLSSPYHVAGVLWSAGTRLREGECCETVVGQEIGGVELRKSVEVQLAGLLFEAPHAMELDGWPCRKGDLIGYEEGWQVGGSPTRFAPAEAMGLPNALLPFDHDAKPAYLRRLLTRLASLSEGALRFARLDVVRRTYDRRYTAQLNGKEYATTGAERNGYVHMGPVLELCDRALAEAGEPRRTWLFEPPDRETLGGGYVIGLALATEEEFAALRPSGIRLVPRSTPG